MRSPFLRTSYRFYTSPVRSFWSRQGLVNNFFGLLAYFEVAEECCFAASVSFGSSSGFSGSAVCGRFAQAGVAPFIQRQYTDLKSWHDKAWRTNDRMKQDMLFYRTARRQRPHRHICRRMLREVAVVIASDAQVEARCSPWAGCLLYDPDSKSKRVLGSFSASMRRPSSVAHRFALRPRSSQSSSASVLCFLQCCWSRASSCVIGMSVPRSTATAIGWTASAWSWLMKC